MVSGTTPTLHSIQQTKVISDIHTKMLIICTVYTYMFMLPQSQQHEIPLAHCIYISTTTTKARQIQQASLIHISSHRRKKCVNKYH